MDTKSKKFSHSFFVRFMAVILLAVLTFVNAFSIAKLARGLILFGAPAATAAAEPVTETNAFAGATEQLISNLTERVNSQNNSQADYLAKKRAEIKENYAETITVYNEIIEDYNTCVLRRAAAANDNAPEVEPTLNDVTAVSESVTGAVPESTIGLAAEVEPAPTQVVTSAPLATAVETYIYREDSEAYTEFDYESARIILGNGDDGEYILKRGDVGFWYYQFLDSDYCHQDNGIANFAADASGYEEYLYEIDNLESYSANNEDLTQYFSELDSADYFIIDKKTGNYFTNISGCKTFADAAATVKNGEWYSCFTNSTFDTNDTRPYNTNIGTGSLYNAPALTFDSFNTVRNLAIQKENLMAASPYYWFLDVVGRYADIDSVSNEYEICIGFDGKFDGADSFAKINAEYTSYPANNFVAMGVLALICFVLFIAIAAITGKDENDNPKKYLVDRLWNDVHFLITYSLISAVVACAVGLGAEFADLTLYSPNAFAITCTISFTLCVLLLLEWLTSVVRHVRMKTFISHTLIAKCILLCIRFIKFCFRPLTRLYRTIKDIGGVKHLPRWIVAAGIGVVVINFILALIAESSGSFFAVFLAFIFDTAVIGIFLWIFLSLDRIMKAVDDTKNGNMNSKVDVNNIFPLLRDFANNVNSVGNGMQTAVDSALKDQRMKAELITNVSHDLKTPLTSIVSYVDLLKRCEVEDEQARKYIDILDEKSQRMKKLIEDLVEASKVSSGAVELHPMKLNLCELAVQAVGENSETLEKNGIELRYRVPEQPVYIMADGQKTSRIIENLFSNVQKYAMPDSRVYAEVLTDGKFGALTIKNVSRYPLDISAEELTQRFVRGDAARSSEGSGLGLSIAHNLCELQGGKCIIYVDGDLFKVTILLPMA